MSQTYVFRKPVQGRHYHKFRRLLMIILLLVIILGGAVGYYYFQSRRQKQPDAVTAPSQVVEFNDNLYVTQSDLFKFSDQGKWVFDRANSTSTKLIYQKYQGQQLLHNLYVFVNTEPSSGDLTVTRVLPVRIVNNNSFDVLNVSNHCGTLYKDGEPHNVKIVKLNNSLMWCNPDAPNYRVIVTVDGGDWHLNLQRQDKSPITFVLVYEDTGLDAKPDDLLRIMQTFQAL